MSSFASSTSLPFEPSLGGHYADCASQSPSTSRAVFWLAVIVVCLALFSAKYEVLATPLYNFNSPAAELEGEGRAGRIINRGFSYLVLASFGLWALFSARGNRLAPRGVLLPLLAALFAWCLTSIAWADDRQMVLMRWVQTCCCALAAVGLVRQLSSRDLRLLILYVSLTYCAIGLGAEIALGSFMPWNNQYRFAGGVHPNAQAGYCALISLSAAALLGQQGWSTRRVVTLFVIGGLLLVLTGSRTSCMSMIVAAMAYWFLRMTMGTRLLVGLGGVFAVCAAVLTTQLVEQDANAQATGLRLLDDTEEAGTLTGRIPLWMELQSFIEARALTGYGYGGFWTVAHKEELYSRLWWIPPSAHNAFLETLLNVGAVGLLLAISIMAVACWRATRGYATTGDPMYAFLLALLGFCITSCFAESLLLFADYLSFVNLLALAYLALDPRPAESFA